MFSDIFSGVSLAVMVLLVLVILYSAARFFYKKAGPDEALIVYGRGGRVKKTSPDGTPSKQGFRIVRGGGTIVLPAWEGFERLSLKVMTLDILLQDVYTVQGIPITVRAVAQVKVKSDVDAIARAAEGFLGLETEQVRATIRETVAGHLRGIVGTLTVEELYRDRAQFQQAVRNEAEEDIEGMGFEFKSLVFQEIQDDQGYLDALGQPKIQEALKNARIARANNDRDAALEEEQARQVKEQKRIVVETEIAQSDKDLSLKKAAIQEEVDVAQAQASKAGELEIKTQDIDIAHKEVERQKLELSATIRETADAQQYERERQADAQAYERGKRAEAERYEIEQKAEADRKRREEQAEALRAEGLAEAAAESAKNRDIGLAEAEAIQAKGEAEAEARRKLAEALKLYNEAGLSIEALKVLPEIAAAVSEPLARAGSTTIISNGGANGSGTGAAKLTEDVVAALSQLGPIMNQLAGVDLSSFLQDVANVPRRIAPAADDDA